MSHLPQLRGKHYHTPGANGPVVCCIVDTQLVCSKSGMQYIDYIQVQRQKVSPQGFTSWTPPRWIRYGRHIQQRIDEYEQQFAKAGGAK